MESDTGPPLAHLPIAHLFVYGTLRPGEVRWPFLEPYVVDEGADDAVLGELFDTGLDYPAAVFADGATTPISGRVYALRAESLDEALRELDIVEGAVRGLYRRVPVTTAAGVQTWAYEFGADPDITLVPIPGGDWLDR
ncbi:MAG: hypothetical protein JWM34_2686 [Ilumatobacteraceae bacterium]|nr:hypothetical protein [Ilumatobacteraceae bacterium]